MCFTTETLRLVPTGVRASVFGPPVLVSETGVKTEALTPLGSGPLCLCGEELEVEDMLNAVRRARIPQQRRRKRSDGHRQQPPLRTGPGDDRLPQHDAIGR